MIFVMIGLQVLTIALLGYAIFTAEREQEEPATITTNDDIEGMY